MTVPTREDWFLGRWPLRRLTDTQDLRGRRELFRYPQSKLVKGERGIVRITTDEFGKWLDFMISLMDSAKSQGKDWPRFRKLLSQIQSGEVLLVIVE
jgi:hypothetical protein